MTHGTPRTSSIGTAAPIARTALLACALILSFPGPAEARESQTNARQSQPGVSNASPAGAATEIDRVVAVVNNELILESDVDEERRFAVFQPYSAPEGSFSRTEAIERLIDRTLILQQFQEQREKRITDAQVEANLNDVRKDIFACKQYHCETAAGWQSFLAANGFTVEELTKLWRERMETLAFIEQRFRTGIRISDDEVKEYYSKTLVPQYAARQASPPSLDSISDRIREILLQEQVSKLLDDWLKTLRASGNVQMMTMQGESRTQIQGKPGGGAGHE